MGTANVLLILKGPPGPGAATFLLCLGSYDFESCFSRAFFSLRLTTCNIIFYLSYDIVFESKYVL